MSRRNLFRRSGQAAAGAGAVWLGGRTLGLDGPGEQAYAATAADGEAPGTRKVTVTEATNASAAPSPDGKTVVLDLLSLLWAVPSEGGTATRLTGLELEATEPDFSPDGRQLVFQAYTDGNFHLWSARSDGSRLRQLTSGSADHREPRWSPDGRHIAYAAELDGRYAVYVLDPATGTSRPWAAKGGKGQEAQPVWRPDGQAIAFTHGEDEKPRSIVEVARDGTRRTLITVGSGRLAGPSYSPDGKRLAYVHLTTGGTALVVDGKTVSDDGEDVFPFAARWLSGEELLYTGDGAVRRRTAGGKAHDVPFRAEVTVPAVQERPARRDFDSPAARQVKGILSPSLSPDGRTVAFAALGDIWTVRRGGGRPRAVVSDGRAHTDPAWSPDGRSLAYAGEHGRHVELFVVDVQSGTSRRLTHLQDTVAGPSFSRDGKHIAFTLNGAGTVHTVSADGGAVRKVAGPLNAPGRPAFSADGSRVSLAALAPFTPRFREGVNKVLTVELSGGEAHYDEPVRGASLVNRLDAGPVFSPDGSHMACVIGGTVHISTLGPDGRPAGEARKLNNESADTPSWSADSRSLLYLSDGTLRLADATTGAARTVPVPLRTRRSLPKGRTVIRAGALWDGSSEQLRHDVDIVLDGNRIKEVADRGTIRTRTGDRTVDARHLTVMPGLVAVHEHGPWHSDTLRLWLSFGVTSLRSPGSGHYASAEAREATASGRRTGPRVFAAGELVDGPRVYYSSGHPVRDETELRREIAKARALDHDMVKTYVRLPYDLQRSAIRAGHELGLRASSHYLFGPLGLGADGVEHLGGTSRYGRRQKETHLGHGYQDVTGPLTASGMAFTPTFGLSGLDLDSTRAALYRYARWAVGDERLTALLPEAEYAEFREGVEKAEAEKPSAELDFEARHGETVRRLVDGGAHVAVGTDSPLVPPGLYYHLNLQHMVRHGVTPRQALRAATAEGARTLGLSGELGVVRPGALADLALVEGNPLEDVRAAAAVRGVVSDGRAWSVRELVSGAEPSAAPGAGSGPEMSAAADEVPQGPAREAFWWHAEHHVGRSCC